MLWMLTLMSTACHANPKLNQVAVLRKADIRCSLRAYYLRSDMRVSNLHINAGT